MPANDLSPEERADHVFGTRTGGASFSEAARNRAVTEIHAAVSAERERWEARVRELEAALRKMMDSHGMHGPCTGNSCSDCFQAYENARAALARSEPSGGEHTNPLPAGKGREPSEDGSRPSVVEGSRSPEGGEEEPSFLDVTRYRNDAEFHDSVNRVAVFLEDNPGALQLIAALRAHRERMTWGASLSAISSENEGLRERVEELEGALLDSRRRTFGEEPCWCSPDRPLYRLEHSEVCLRARAALAGSREAPTPAKPTDAEEEN